MPVRMEQIDDKLFDKLTGCPLFRGLNREEIAAILTGSSVRIRTFRKGSVIAQAGEKVHFLHLVIGGSVKAEMVDYAGKVIKIEDIFPPRPLAPAFLFGSQNSYPVNLTAAEDVQILSIPREAFLGMMQASQKVLLNFINNVSSRGQFLSSKIKFLSFSTIKGKLAQYLLDISAMYGAGHFLLPHSQSQLSELFGVARPSVGRAMGELNREGIIRTEGKEVRILDSARLSGLLR